MGNLDFKKGKLLKNLCYEIMQIINGIFLINHYYIL